MDLLTFIRSYLTLSTISKVMERVPQRKSVIYNKVFTNRNNNPSAYVRVDDIIQTIGSVPVVTRGGQAVRVSGESMGTGLIEPMPIRLSDFFTGARLNDLRAFWGNGDKQGKALVQAEIDRIIKKLMMSTQKTRDALCAQAMTGKIDYQMKSDSGFVRYEVNFGDVTTYAPTKKWNADGTKIGDVLSNLIYIRKKLHESGHSGSIGFLAPTDTWTTLANLVTSLPNDQRMGAKVDDNVITVGGFRIELDDASYSDRTAGGEVTTKDEIEAKKLLAYVEDVPVLEYCAIDDIDGNLQPTPFFAKSLKSDDPSGIKILSESKPMPLVAPTAILIATVLS